MKLMDISKEHLSRRKERPMNRWRMQW